MKEYLIGVDNGGTNIKAAVFDIEGNQLSVASRSIDTLNPKPGFCERDLEELWQTNAAVIQESIELSGIPAEKIAGISIAGHGKGLYMVDENGLPVYNGIVSTDSRAWQYSKEWHEDGTADKVFNLTFQDILASQPVALLRWFADNKPEVLNKCRWIFSVKDYIRYKLTGEIYAEYSDSSGSNLINLTTKNYDTDVLSLFDLEFIKTKLPQLKNSADICGLVGAEAAKLTGLPEGIPVAGGMFDINACGIAAGMIDEEQVCMIAGTWSINEYIAKIPVKDKSIMLNSLFCISGYYLIEESSPTSASNLEWFIKTYIDGIAKLLDIEKKSVYSQIDEIVTKVRPEATNLVFLPFIYGSNENPIAKSAFVGMSAEQDISHILQSIFEGIVFSHYSHCLKLFANRKWPGTIRLAGGVTNSKPWVQMFADVFQTSIEVIQGKELGCHGAAIAAGIASGLYKNYQDAVNKTVKISYTIKPNADNKDIYQKKYNNYQKVVESLDSYWNQTSPL